MNQMKMITLAVVLKSLLLSACASTQSEPTVQPAGQPEQTSTSVLETGAQALQTKEPAEQLNVYLVGFHPMKNDSSKQMEAHHFCKQVNEELAQCALFDGNTAQANLNGIEYIISKNLYDQLPEQEKQYWHPHNYEILSGQLAAPGLPDAAEHELMEKKMNSYGKTWHVWDTGHAGMPGDKVPMGAAMLAWSFNHDGEIMPSLVEQRDQKLDINTSEKRQNRQDLVQFAQPQDGVNALATTFQSPIQSIPGVVGTDEPAAVRAPASEDEKPNQ